MNERDRFRLRLAAGPLVADGAMGTLLYSRGVPQRANLDDLIASRPELITAIHREYLDAGAELIETATFGANRVRLAAFGMGDRVATLNRRGAQLAREARDVSGREAWVAGSIGPLGAPNYELLHLPDSEVRAAVREQLDGLLEGEFVGPLLDISSPPEPVGDPDGLHAPHTMGCPSRWIPRPTR